MKVAVVGSRNFNNYELLKETLDKLNISLIVSGGAKGADSMSEVYAKEHGIETLIFKPDWSLGRHAGFLRNENIVNNCNVLVAFWDGKSSGTKHSIDLAYKKNKVIKIVNF